LASAALFLAGLVTVGLTTDPTLVWRKLQPGEDAVIPQDVPSPIDFGDIAQARAWIADTVARRPSRPRFFEAFAAALKAHFEGPIRVAELGSGPGHLADVILRRCSVESYIALDFSLAMREIAREHLGNLAAQVRFVIADFRDPAWVGDVGEVDALVTMQAAHEVRHKSRLPLLLAQAHEVIRPGGVFLFGDHYAEPGAKKNTELYVTRDEQPVLLAEAGFAPVSRVHDEGGMALYLGIRGAA
jgi:SAM-dependent methyltransferase